MTDDSPDAPWPEPAPSGKHRRPRNPLATLLKPATTAANATVRMTKTLLHEGMQTLLNPSHVLDRAKQGADVAAATAKLLLLPPDAKTVFKGQCGVPKRAVWSEPIALDEVKAIGKATDSTVNDVLLTAVSGALRRYMQQRGDQAEGVDIRAVVPVNLRPPSELEQMGNRFGLVILSLPVGVAGQAGRLVALKERMNAIKDSPEALVSFGILNAIGMTPAEIESQVIALLGTKATAVMTNVPGPRHPIYLVGQPVRNLMFWVPHPGNLGMGVSILSYAGQVTIGVTTDVGLVPDPETIVEAFHTEFDQMVASVRRAATPEKRPTPAKASAPAKRPAQAKAPTQAKRASKAKRKTAAVPVAASEPGRCQALTKAGKPCQNYPLPGTAFCRVHSVVPEAAAVAEQA
jgi:diacylglycerol O-acyltransferase